MTRQCLKNLYSGSLAASLVLLTTKITYDDVELVEDTEDDVEETMDEVLLVLEGATLELELESAQAPAVSS
jgi:hypothetical protein